jgi:hypothetical protein
MRASDAERDRAADALRQHHADGRLDTDELEERTGRAYAATTLDELDQLFADLPRLRSAGGPGRLSRWRPAFASPFTALLFAVAVLLSAHALFLVWPLMFFLFFRFRFMGRASWWHGRSWPEASRRY